MTAIKQLIRREIISREREFVATVISNPSMVDFDQSASGAPTWVVDLDIGGNRPAKNVPIKASGSGDRFYAQLGQTVLVRRTALGRLYVIGPGDRTAGSLVETVYSLETGNPSTVTTTEFVRRFFPLEYYQGTAMLGNPTVTFAVEAGDDSITRSAGSFIDDGFSIGQQIRVMRSTLNDAVFTLTGVTALQLLVSTALQNEGPIVGGVTIGVVGTSRWNDGVTFFPFSRLEDASGNPV